MDSLIFELQIVFYFQLFLSPNVRHRDMAVMGLLRIHAFMQIVVNNSSSMKPVNVLNNFYTKILPFAPF